MAIRKSNDDEGGLFKVRGGGAGAVVASRKSGRATPSTLIYYSALTCWLLAGPPPPPPPPPLLVTNIDFIPFLRALSSPSTTSLVAVKRFQLVTDEGRRRTRASLTTHPKRMLTRAYSISERKTKTVQPDMNTSMACAQCKKNQIILFSIERNPAVAAALKSKNRATNFRQSGKLLRQQAAGCDGVENIKLVVERRVPAGIR